MSTNKRMTNDESSKTRMRKLLGVLVIAFGASYMVGCQKPDSDLEQISTGAGQPIASNTKAPDNSTMPNSSGDSDVDSPTDPGTEGVKKYIESIKPTESELKIDENSESWKNAEPVAAPIAATLGTKIDDGLASLPPSLVIVGLECVDRGSILKSNPKAKIQDKNHFSIEYTFPEDQGSTNSITANGSERVVFESGKVTKLAPLGQSETRVKLSRAEIEEFARRMPADGFRYFSHGDRPWSALVSGLQDPKNNFDVKITEMDANPVGDKRPFYRLIAHSTKGIPLDIEIVVDSKRNVPVVFRATSKYPDGQDRRLVWKGAWQFGGTFTKDEFKLPMKK